MLRKLLTENYPLTQNELQGVILQSLKNIELHIEKELSSKQKELEVSWDEVKKLRALLEGKDQVILELNKKLADVQSNSEGNRQLINKLLNDLSKARTDIEWYKRTYESRSLLGILKQKLVKKLR